MWSSGKFKIIEETPFGEVGILWEEIDSAVRVLRVLLPPLGLSPLPQSEEVYSPQIEQVAGELRKILQGTTATIPLKMVALETCTPFQQEVLRQTARIPRGTVVSYRELAAAIGRPRAARAVGNALAANPFPLIVPCHRVIRSDGRIGGFTGEAGMKRRLLELEGVRCDVSRVARAFLPAR